MDIWRRANFTNYKVLKGSAVVPQCVKSQCLRTRLKKSGHGLNTTHIFITIEWKVDRRGNVLAYRQYLTHAPTKAQRKDLRLNEVLMVAKMGKAEVAALEGMVMESVN